MSLIPKKGTVYVVDDDEAVRDSLQWLLEGKDYRVKCFDSAESFLSRFDPREVACVICDIRMDGMNGLELQDRLIERLHLMRHHHHPHAINLDQRTGAKIARIARAHRTRQREPAIGQF